MQKIKIGRKEINYLLKESKRARRVRLCIFHGGAVTVTMPQGFSLEKVEKFIFEKTEWILEKIKIMEKKDYNPVFHKFGKREYQKHKKQALALVKDKIEELNRTYKFSYNRISIRNSRSRWGSCSAKGNLNFSYKIIFLPEDFQNYIIVHELCHLGEFNHSKKFWNLVEKTIPDYREIRRKIRKI